MLTVNKNADSERNSWIRQMRLEKQDQWSNQEEQASFVAYLFWLGDVDNQNIIEDQEENKKLFLHTID